MGSPIAARRARVIEFAAIGDADSLRRCLTERFGAVPGEEAGVLHVAAVWRPPGDDRNIVLRIREETPRSELDFLLLNLARARADAIVTTGRILREEPELTHDLRGPGGVPPALHAWRRERLGLRRPPWLLVLTTGRDLDPDHPALHAWARPLVFCPLSRVDEVRRRLGGAPVAVVGDAEPGLRAALDHLETERDARRISIEAGPSTSKAAYEDPPRVDELVLSVYAEGSIPAELAGGELPRRFELECLFGPPRGSFSAEEPSGRWIFERYRCAIVRRQATPGREAPRGNPHWDRSR